MRIEDVYNEVQYDECLERILEVIRVGILKGKSNTKIAREAGLRDEKGRFKTEVVRAIREAAESKKRRLRRKGIEVV